MLTVIHKANIYASLKLNLLLILCQQKLQLNHSKNTTFSKNVSLPYLFSMCEQIFRH